MKTAAVPLVLLCSVARLCARQPDVPLAEFEETGYGAWTAEGAAFGSGPAHGALPGQMPVDGFDGKGLVNSFNGGDRSTGTLTSPEFRIERRYLTFLIGGGGFAGKTCMNLVVDGKTVRSAAGPNTEPGGKEQLEPGGWDVSEFMGRTARIQIVDAAQGGWGHINVDHLVQTDAKPALLAKDVAREIVAQKRLLQFPVKNGAKKRKVEVLVDGKVERAFDIELADAEPDWWAPLDISAWRGRTLTVRADRLPDDSRALAQIQQSDEIEGAANLYGEPLRPQFHFSARRGWLNDPNGLAYYNGEYHLFFQHNPYGWNWGNMHWGHAVSRDLVNWRELDEALYPDAFGPMFSGSAVVDWKNTSGFGKDGQPPLVLLYTAAGQPTTQCIAYSTDGRSITKYNGNPVLNQITGGNRDPKVFWHEPTGRWVMILYVEAAGKKHTVHVLHSPNLRDWTLGSVIEGGTDKDHFLYECPDLFELPVDGNPANRKWVLTAANSEYQIGSFDGVRFTPETPKLPGQQGRGFYAAQTFSDEPNGRRIQIGWLQAPSPGMPFNQCMSLPQELTLVSTADGPRLARRPVKELERLRSGGLHSGVRTLAPGDPDPLHGLGETFFEVTAEFEPSRSGELRFQLRGISVVYDAAKQEISVNGHPAPAPLKDGKQRLRLYVDSTSIEVFASDGLTYVPVPVIPKENDFSITVSAAGAPVNFTVLDIDGIPPRWERKQ